MGAPYIYDISHLRVNSKTYHVYVNKQMAAKREIAKGSQSVVGISPVTGPHKLSWRGAFLGPVAYIFHVASSLRCIRQKDRHCMYKRSIEVRSLSHCCRGKAITITYS